MILNPRYAVPGPFIARGFTAGIFGILTLVLTASAMAASDEDPQYAAVKGLGQLNGVALQCGYIDQVRRMKAAVVASAPKDRSFGLAFDTATNEAFLAFIKDDETCPVPGELERRVGHQIDTMKAAFAAP